MSKFKTALQQLAEDAKSKPEQSVYFIATFRYDRSPKTRETEKQRFDCFETMIMTYRQARKRRAIADRPTSMTYKTIELEQVTKEEWKQYGHIGQDGIKRILKYKPNLGTCLVPCIVIS